MTDFASYVTRFSQRISAWVSGGLANGKYISHLLWVLQCLANGMLRGVPDIHLAALRVSHEALSLQFISISGYNLCNKTYR